MKSSSFDKYLVNVAELRNIATSLRDHQNLEPLAMSIRRRIDERPSIRPVAISLNIPTYESQLVLVDEAGFVRMELLLSYPIPRKAGRHPPPYLNQYLDLSLLAVVHEEWRMWASDPSIGRRFLLVPYRRRLDATDLIFGALLPFDQDLMDEHRENAIKCGISFWAYMQDGYRDWTYSAYIGFIAPAPDDWQVPVYESGAELF